MDNLPFAFIQRMHDILQAETDNFMNALREPSPVSIRFNTAKVDPANLKQTDGLVKQSVPWCPEGVYLDQRPRFTLDPYLHGGGYYVQEASSMFLSYMVKQLLTEEPVRVLDLCAAPGGKSTLLASQLPAGSLLVSNEVIRSRAAVLKENLIKWGGDQVVITQNDPADFKRLRNTFDILLVDAPCSGEGMFRKDPETVKEWSETHLRLCSERQKRIVGDVWDCIKPGGYLIYSTCTYNPEENEEMIRWIQKKWGAESIQIEHHFPEITSTVPPLFGYRFYPHKVKGEGFFISVLRKNDSSAHIVPKMKKTCFSSTIRLPEELTALLPDRSTLAVRNENSRIFVLPAIQDEFVSLLEQSLRVIYKGCEVGELVHQKVKRLHPLALYVRLNSSNCLRDEVDLNTALRFLKKEDIPVSAKAGEWVLITYGGIGLGWGKSVGNRLNNYYPKEWRIRMELPSGKVESVK